MCEFLISRIFYVIFLDHNWPQVTETAESKIVRKWVLLYNEGYYHVEALHILWETLPKSNEENDFDFFFLVEK